MSNDEAKELRERCISELGKAMLKSEYFLKVADIDPRLSEYIYRCIDPATNYANLYELLGIRKFLRMLVTYPFDTDKVHKIYRAYEHLKFSGMDGRRQYQLTPMQCFQLAAPFGFMKSKDDWRRVCTEANYFVPRKSSKTTLAAFFNFWFFFFEDYNTECYCVANAQQQSKILFDLTKDLIRQMDPEGKNIRFTATEITWHDHNIRQSSVTALSAGGKTKDGLFAGLCCADEYGSAAYVKDHSDMANLVGVVEGSMGPRREPMTVITTTAGRVTSGPYQVKLEGIKQSLVREMEYPLNGKAQEDAGDWQFALVCCPDQWEEDDESLQKPEIWQKVNHHIGVTIQPDFYKNEWAKMLLDPEKRKEQVTKLFNVWQSDRVVNWLTASDIIPLQVEFSIEDCKGGPMEGWQTFVGFDFSQGNDLHAVSYLSYDLATGRFFADMDAWIDEYHLNESPLAGLYRQWVEKGWLRVVPGKVITEDVITERMIELYDKGVYVLGFGYDAYRAKTYVNNLKAWLFSMGSNPDALIRPVSQGYATYTGPVDEMEYMIHSDPPLIHFSMNPMWGWEFGGCMLQESPDQLNKKPIKGGSHDSCKVDNVQALLTALSLYDGAEGSVSK